MSSLVVRIFPMPVATLVTMAGEVDISTVAQLRGELLTIPARNTVVEVSGLELLSAAGLRALLDLQDRLARVDARVALAAAPAIVRRVLTVTGLDARLVMAPTVEAAVTEVASPVARQPMPIRATAITGPCRAAVRGYPSLRGPVTGVPRSSRG